MGSKNWKLQNCIEADRLGDMDLAKIRRLFFQLFKTSKLDLARSKLDLARSKLDFSIFSQLFVQLFCSTISLKKTLK